MLGDEATFLKKRPTTYILYGIKFVKTEWR